MNEHRPRASPALDLGRPATFFLAALVLGKLIAGTFSDDPLWRRAAAIAVAVAGRSSSGRPTQP